MTLQTWAVLVIGGVLGRRQGALVIFLYLIAAGCGLPVLAGGHGGTESLTGPTAGYLLGFVAAAWLVGRSADMGAHQWRALLPAMLAGHGVILLLGVAWLSTFTGIEKALTSGLLPFGVGAVVKSVMAAITVPTLARR